MRIAVLSDTHKLKVATERAAKLAEGADLLVHLGDNTEDVEIIKQCFKGKIINVRGNCDFSSFIPSERLEIVENKKIFFTHGDRYNVKHDLLKLRYKALEVGADIVLFGHTHISYIGCEEGIWFINPGSPSIPKGGEASIALIEINEGKISSEIKYL